MTKIVISALENDLPTVISLIVGLYGLFEDRDIGQFIGEPADYYLRRQPISLGLKVIFHDVKAPPFYSRGYTRVECRVPELNRSACTWENVKRVAGGSNGYVWGRFRCTASVELQDGSISQITCYGGSKQSAEERVLAMHSLSVSKIVKLSYGEDNPTPVKGGNPGILKQRKQIYPAYMVITNKKRVQNLDERTKGKTIQALSGKYKEVSGRIPLFPKNKPDNADSIIQEALSNIVS